MKTYKAFMKEFSGVAGIAGVAPGDEPPQKKSKIARRCKVFEVSDDTLWNCRVVKGKHDRFKKFVGSEQVGEEIRTYAKLNPNEDIMVRSKDTGAMYYLRKK